MLSIFVMLIIAISITAGIGYGILTLIKSGEVSLGIQKNQARMEIIAEAIRSNLKAKDGVILVPVNRDGTGKAEAVPPSVSPFTVTAYNKPITYCPISMNSVGGSPTTMTGSESYPVELEELPAASGNWYVKAGAPGSSIDGSLTTKGVVAYLLSPAPNTPEADLPLKCADVAYAPGGEANTQMIITGGSVTPVFAVAPDVLVHEFSVNGAADAPEWAAHFASMEEVADYIVAKRIVDDVTIWLPDSAEIEADKLQALATQMKGKVLRLVGSATRTALSVDAPGSGAVMFEGSLFAESVDFAGSGFDVTVGANPSGDVHLKNVTIGGLLVNGGRVSITGTSFIGSTAAYPVVLNGGSLYLGSQVKTIAPSASVVFSVNGGSFAFEGNPVVETTATEIVKVSGKGTVTSTAGTLAFRPSESDDPVEISIDPPVETMPAVACVPGTECDAECPTGRKIVAGGCQSDDNQPLAAFGVDVVANSYFCRWATSSAAPKAIATCQ